jgi:murein DD-endopeptidase MepM/ murein hydrolase activator NlpD
VTNDTAIGSSILGNAAPAKDAKAASDATRQRVKQMAQEFEATLVTQMLREMRRSMLSDEDDENGLGKDTMTDSLDIELGGVLSRAGGFGLADALSKALNQRSGDDAVAIPAAADLRSNFPLKQPPAGKLPLAIESPAAAPTPESPASGTGTLEVPHGRLSSAFGWRSDPFKGVARFHNGIDVAQAYGQDVRAAAAGRVAFSGERGSYGTTVIVEHAGGRQTLYAHLSTTGVRAGDVVAPGQVIGQSGNSGHSTGPHLHFEVLDGGRPVNPVGMVAARVEAGPASAVAIDGLSVD